MHADAQTRAQTQGGHKGSQLVQPWADTRGHSTAMGRH